MMRLEDYNINNHDHENSKKNHSKLDFVIGEFASIKVTIARVQLSPSYEKPPRSIR